MNTANACVEFLFPFKLLKFAEFHFDMSIFMVNFTKVKTISIGMLKINYNLQKKSVLHSNFNISVSFIVCKIIG